MSQVLVSQPSTLVRENLQPLKDWAAEFWDEAVTFVQPKQFGWFQDFSRRRIVNRFSRIEHGCIELQHANSVDVLGPESSQDRVTIGVHDAKFYSRVLLGGTIGAADSYIANEWSTNDLTSLIRILIRNMGPMGTLEQTWGRLKRSMHRFDHLLRKEYAIWEPQEHSRTLRFGKPVLRVVFGPNHELLLWCIRTPERDHA